MPRSIPGLNIQTGEKLVSHSRRVMFGNMVVLRDPGQVYMMTIEMLRNRIFKRPAHSQVQRIDPVTLETVKSSPKLKGGNIWPGGVAVHQNGDLYVTYGSYCHRLDPDCNLVGSYELPKTEPYNSLVILDNGYLVMKQLSETNRAVLSILDPDLRPVCEPIETI
jgi:sugar lactone lactonase YvrE